MRRCARAFTATGWVGSEDRALVHRSPNVAPGQSRLVLTIDPA
ncbi:DUF1826 domain-containing protein [Larsenimonas suaedae]|uniref:DUF1826 domain-containing protein n=1 Tax=Larsenimonas suaedae TaxID=1851019 RepID=A0ABU1GRG9_9GAMM|nr:DUF1826 domain-containing protein [Larsenimonas suaedae]MCM2972584.1 DUF1826 domain-containing protein [Larsenimonas suaedae]MDR5894620.1 DUF1826 domain-containing protein [Larsenimonas suaedae]